MCYGWRYHHRSCASVAVAIMICAPSDSSFPRVQSLSAASFLPAQRFTTNWSKYGAAYGLWNPRKPEAEKKLIDKAPNAVYFDTRLAAYSRLAEGVDQLAVSKDIGFLRVDCYPVAVAVKTQAHKLKSEFGRALREIGRRRLDEFTSKIRELRASLDAKPEDLTALKAVLSTVAVIMDSKIDMELLAADISERYRTLEAHGVEVEADELTAAMDTLDTWQATVDAALTKDARWVVVMMVAMVKMMIVVPDTLRPI